MSNSIFKVTQLSQLDLKDGPQDTLKKCLELDIPVYITCPKDRTLWAVPHDIEECIAIIKNHRRGKDVVYYQETSRLKPAPTYIDSKALLLKLTDEDVRLLMMDATGVVKSQKIYELNDGETEGYTFKKSISALPIIIDGYWPHLDWYERNKEKVGLLTYKSMKAINVHGEYIARYFYFTLCKMSKSSLLDIDDPLNDTLPIKVNAEDCYIPNDAVKQFTEYTVGDIPEGSPYYLPDDCRHSQVLNELAVLGQKLYQDKSVPLKVNVAKQVEEMLNVSPKMALTASFFINPKPAGKMEGKRVLQFQNLIEVYRRYCLGEGESLNKRIGLEFISKYGYSQDNGDYAAALISPKKQ